jgi:ferritin-like metal-binding protein YciE
MTATPKTQPRLDQDLETFEQLPAKTKELEVLQDQAQKTIGKENLAMNQKIRDKTEAKLSTKQSADGGRSAQAATSSTTLKKLFLDRLAVIYDAEIRLVTAMQQMAKVATCGKLQEAITAHLQEKQSHVTTLESIFASLEVRANRKTSEATIALLYESHEVISQFKDFPVINAALIGSVQKIEHYEIASYGCLRDWAAVLGYDDVAQSLQKILDQDKATNQALTDLARSHSNHEALHEKATDNPTLTSNTHPNMKTNIGLWIDQRRAVIVLGSGDNADIQVILSHADRQPGRIDGKRSLAPYETQRVEADDVSQRKFTGELDHYYEEILSVVRGAQSLLIFGPGEAKGHLHKHLEESLAKTCTVHVEPADKMTDRQVAAHVREHFKNAPPIILSK